MNDLLTHLTTQRGAILLLGPPGTGKTVLCTQLPRPAILEIDNNLRGPVRFVKDRGLKTDAKVEVPHIDATGKIVPRSQRYTCLANAVDKLLIDPNIDTIVIDSLFTLREYIEDEVRRQEGVAIAGENGKTQDGKIEIQHWLKFAALTKHLFVTIKSSGKLFVVTGHIDGKEDLDLEKGAQKILLKYVAYPGLMGQNMAALFDECWLMSTALETEKVNGQYVERAVRYITTSPRDARDATLGLKTAIGLGLKFKVDFEELNKKLAL